MKLIKRSYLDILIRTINTPDIKVITGVRRSGKSKLIDLFKSYILSNIKNNNVIYINYSLAKYENIREYHKLIEYVDNNYQDDQENFLLIDEVQMCDGFEQAINNFHAEEKYHIYITGSNAFLLSSNLATLFTGRTFEIEVFPFSYKEYLDYYLFENSDANFDKYVKEGGMAGSYLYENINDKYNYIKEVYNTLIIRDIKEKYNIKDELLVERITEFLIDNISNLTSMLNITNILNNNDIETTDKTVGNYVSYLCNSFLFYKFARYDIAGKKYLSSNSKYYLIDTSFKYAINGTKNPNYGRVYENIVAIELLRRGYEVYVGVLYEKEIDFVAIKRDEKIYIQVSDNISDEKTFNREVSSLLKIRDAYPKILIARTHHEAYQYEGIQVIDIAEWLIK